MLRGDGKKSNSKSNSFQYEILDGGVDARLLTGEKGGSLVSELMKTSKGRSYLGWLYTLGGLDDLREVIERAHED